MCDYVYYCVLWVIIIKANSSYVLHARHIKCFFFFFTWVNFPPECQHHCSLHQDDCKKKRLTWALYTIQYNKSGSCVCVFNAWCMLDYSSSEQGQFQSSTLPAWWPCWDINWQVLTLYYFIVLECLCGFFYPLPWSAVQMGLRWLTFTFPQLRHLVLKTLPINTNRQHLCYSTCHLEHSTVWNLICLKSEHDLDWRRENQKVYECMDLQVRACHR